MSIHTLTIVVERRDGEDLDAEAIRGRLGDEYRLSAWGRGTVAIVDAEQAYDRFGKKS